MVSEGNNPLSFDDFASLDLNEVKPTDSTALNFLTEANLETSWLISHASNYTFLVELNGDNKRSLGIYKPLKGEAPLWDFPNGNLYKRECAAFALSQNLGWPLVPPTIQRDGPLGIGSLQLYVPPVQNSNYFSIKDSKVPELLSLAIFDLVVNNADRKGRHCFEAKCGGVWAIDHGLTFHELHKLRTVIWDFAGFEIPEPFLGDLGNLLNELNTFGSLLLSQLSALIVQDEINSLIRRLDGILREPVFPKPISNRDLPYPWI